MTPSSRFHRQRRTGAGAMASARPGRWRNTKTAEGLVMAVYVDTGGSVQGFERILDAAVHDDRAGTLLIFSCDANAFAPELLDPILRSVKIPIIGGTFPAIFHDQTRLDQGTVIRPGPSPSSSKGSAMRPSISSTPSTGRSKARPIFAPWSSGWTGLPGGSTN
jgi:hypothetical protein